MSATDHRWRPPAGLTRFPEFELAYRFDDPDDPAEVTVFPTELPDDRSTTWITIDVGHAVPLDAVQ